METIGIDQDIQVFYVTAKSFPNGIMEAFANLRAKLGQSKPRRIFGISRPENGVIVYKAAAEELAPGEGEKLHCKTLTLKKGKYVSTTIRDFMQDPSVVGRTFEQLLSNPNIDPEGYCVELYLDNNKDVRCMVRLKD